MKGQRRLTALVILLLVVAVQTATAGDKLFMWQAESATATVTMVGSIHVGQAGFFPLADPYEKAFAAASVLAVEVDMTDPAVLQESAMLMMQKGMLPGDETLQTRLEPALYARLETYAQENNVPLAMYQKFKPGIVAMMLVMDAYQKQGFDPELGIDKHFLDAAKAAGKEIRSLETVADQLDLFLEIDDTLDDILVAEFLDQTVDIKAETAEMIGYWQDGDAEGLDRFLQSEIGDTPEMVAFYRTLLDDRNVAMADSVAAWLDGDTDIFMAVGAGHYAGENGIVALLQKRGLAVAQVGK